MTGIYPYTKKKLLQYKNIFLLLILFSSCTIPRKYQKGKPFVYENTIEVKGGNFTNYERADLKQRLNAQLDDSSRTSTKDILFLLHYLQKPPVFDTAAAARSARNMKASMLHLGYYYSTVGYDSAVWKRKNSGIKIFLNPFGNLMDIIFRPNIIKLRIATTYTVNAGKPTLIDTLSYRLKKPDLQLLAQENIKESFLQKGKPVSKTAVLAELGRMVELFRNNGYYKFTSEELKVRGDTTLDILTDISGDPFEQLQALADAQSKKDSPKIKLQIILNTPKDSTKLKKYYIGQVYVMPDYIPGDKLSDPTLTENISRSGNYIFRYHNRLFVNNFLMRNIFLRKGDVFSQNDFYRTLNSLSKTGVWQSVNIIINEVKDSSKLDMVIQLIPTAKNNFQASAEVSYSANSNSNSATVAGAGNLFGLSGNLSWLNRNWLKQGIKMTNAVSAGIEFNKNRSGQSSNNNVINSNEVGISNVISFPKLVLPDFIKIGNKNSPVRQTNTNLSLSFINRINLFNLRTIRFNTAHIYSWKQGKQIVFKLVNIESSKLYNPSAAFLTTLNDNPFLRYSFNSALVVGMGIGYSESVTNPKNSTKQHSLKINLEESGNTYGRAGIFKNDLRHFVKMDIEYTYSKSFKKAALITRIFAGAGIPTFKSDTTLPFFKQYFGGGSNSMRGWPIRGIGRGSQPLAPYDKNVFNDRTGDIQFESNIEFRHNIAQLIPNTLTLRGALFADIGNVWNKRNSKSSGTDSTQFKLKNFYKDLGVSAGYGFRLDFNYFILRFDFGFRFKRPEDRYNGNDGWKIPALSFNDAFQKIFTKGKDDEYRKWRYENFNLTIGIGYSFN